MSSSVALPDQSVLLRGTVEQVFNLLAALDGAVILYRDTTSAAAEFHIPVGRFRFITKERVTFDPEAHRIEFDQLQPPFHGVADAHEVFQLEPVDGGSTRLMVSAVLHSQGGVLGWLLTRWLVGYFWWKVERRHLDRLRERCEVLFASSSEGRTAGERGLPT